MSNVMTFQKASKAITGHGYKYVSLYRTDGTKLLGWNQGKGTMTAAQRLKAIDKRLQSPAVADGLYIIKAKNSARHDAEPDEFIIQKGDAAAVPVIPLAAPSKPEPTAEVRSYTEALDDKTALAKLQLQLDAVEKERDELAAQLDSAEALAEEYADAPEPAGFMAQLLPLAEKFLDLQTLQAQMKLQQSQPVAPVQQMQQPMEEEEELEPEDVHEHLEEILNEYPNEFLGFMQRLTELQDAQTNANEQQQTA